MLAGDGLVVTMKSVRLSTPSFLNREANMSTIGMGHVRLKIIDMTDAGTQPFYDEESDIHAATNGELYDWEQYQRRAVPGAQV